MKNISVIILHFGKYQDTAECLDSIKSADKNMLNVKVFLVNNGTKDNFSQYKNIIVIRNNKNLGFAAGINRGLREALKDKRTSHFLILNNDTVLPADYFEKIAGTDFDITGAVVNFKNAEDEDVYDYGGSINYFTGRTNHLEKNIAEKTDFYPDYVSGCCMIVSRPVLETTGLFDERFFFYFEDVDYCLRAKKAGYRVGVNQNVTVKHKLSSAIGRWSDKAIYYNLVSNFKIVNKHFGLNRLSAWMYLSLLTVKIIWDKISKR
ncbi:MAG: glycosyltransferase [Candidatus Gottesmanbacteria bacterium GW2011_GWA2_43_14]|uniref:Glycosyltransferase n=1 Tax=Candidatus Gottesmanbacteria bacterium GW2011_GWA2_43_14 TaxID=1618443 RepID=A0A0G1DLL2_9BACT|nr:MAG: glycosyltransferase [Candidatus Gottesmanbacteria bacterium GW2011_GWA2_43_14]